MENDPFIQHLLHQIDLRDQEIAIYQQLNAELNRVNAELKEMVFYLKYKNNYRKSPPSSSRGEKKQEPAQRRKGKEVAGEVMSLEHAELQQEAERHQRKPTTLGDFMPYGFTSHCLKDKKWEPRQSKQGSSSGSNDV